MLRYRKTFACLMVLILLSASLSGCSVLGQNSAHRPDLLWATQDSTQQLQVYFGSLYHQCKKSENAITAQTVSWTGEFSDDRLKEAIQTYNEQYTPIALRISDFENGLQIYVGEGVTSRSVSRISMASEDVDTELRSYLDTMIPSEYDASSGHLSIGAFWWFDDDGSWVQDHPVWSFLICTKDASGAETYHYFRVSYSK